MMGQITKAGGTNARIGGTFVPPVIQLKYALPLSCLGVGGVTVYWALEIETWFQRTTN